MPLVLTAVKLSIHAVKSIIREDAKNATLEGKRALRQHVTADPAHHLAHAAAADGRLDRPR